MTIEGLLEFEAIRDFLYTRMRGQQAGAGTVGQAAAPPIRPVSGMSTEAAGEVAVALRELAGELRGVREVLEGRASSYQKDGGQ
jgi:putative membrane protein